MSPSWIALFWGYYQFLRSEYAVSLQHLFQFQWTMLLLSKPTANNPTMATLERLLAHGTYNYNIWSLLAAQQEW